MGKVYKQALYSTGNPKQIRKKTYATIKEMQIKTTISFMLQLLKKGKKLEVGLSKFW